jgi:hypothetical protein
MDKIPAAIVILIGTGVVAILAGLNDAFGKFLLVFMVIVAVVWLMGGGVQGKLTSWTSLITGTNSGSEAQAT